MANTKAIKLVGLSGSPRRPSRSRNLVEIGAQMTTRLIALRQHTENTGAEPDHSVARASRLAEHRNL